MGAGLGAQMGHGCLLERATVTSISLLWRTTQVITNACATQAIVSVLLNRPELEIGAELAQLREFTAGFPPDMKGEAAGRKDMCVLTISA